MVKIRIIKRPAGEAPEWVRDAWIGLELNSVNDTATKALSVGVLSGPKSRFGQLLAMFTGKAARHVGFAVPADQAITLLSAHNREAATWWRKNCPNLSRPEAGLQFQVDECEVIPNTSPWG